MFEIYSKVSCPFCEKAKELLNKKNLEYREYIIGEHVSRDLVLEKFPQIKTVPIILKNGEYIGSYVNLVQFLWEK